MTRKNPSLITSQKILNLGNFAKGKGGCKRKKERKKERKNVQSRGLLGAFFGGSALFGAAAAGSSASDFCCPEEKGTMATKVSEKKKKKSFFSSFYGEKWYDVLTFSPSDGSNFSKSFLICSAFSLVKRVWKLKLKLVADKKDKKKKKRKKKKATSTHHKHRCWLALSVRKANNVFESSKFTKRISMSLLRKEREKGTHSAAQVTLCVFFGALVLVCSSLGKKGSSCFTSCWIYSSQLNDSTSSPKRLEI